MNKGFLMIIVLLATSCSTSYYLKTDEIIEKKTPTNPQKIEVYSTDKASKSYQILGQVIANADAGENANKSVDLLKKRASEIGADAIINLKLEFTFGYWATGIKAKGIAVKYN